MTIAGIILLVVAVVCFFVARGQASRVQAMAVAETFTAQMVAELYQKVAGALGADALAEQCEVAGVIECDAPLTGPVSGTTCVAYSRSVVREYEEEVTTTDAQGKQTTNTERRTETLESEDRKVRFWVRDATGRVLVDPEQAEIDLVETANRYEPAPPAPAGRTRTLGYRYREQALATGTQVYVLGCAVDGQGQAVIARNPRDGKQKFIISRRTEQELTRSAMATARGFYYAAAGCGAVGLILLVVGLVR